MAGKRINIDLTFRADTKQAQLDMVLLLQTLSNLSAMTPGANVGTKMAASIQLATVRATELKVALNNATNVNTGKLNFSKLSQQLAQNKMSVLDYARSLALLGPQGTLALLQLTTALRLSETPLVSLQGKAAALAKTFANTAKWMISSAALQGITRAFTSTIDYAKELNESLNNIRIVTGKSVEDMSRFAKEANKAAKALSATTTEYTDASLIYFQLGLNDKLVKERADTTLRLAKVVGEEAATVSEWMTAIWNNFDDGSQKLEYYADVLAKLGAATASSADEIAGGLEKFAAVSDTVGLSYEYAASALATVTAETRQSEDVVGTAFKTIFARIEGLKLGETLEDGTTLNQYSEALAKVGVNIQDQQGELRKMDDILQDIGTRWEVLNSSQQVALAQSVAGIRQYNQFISLMDNWDVMEENLELTREANGELEYQYDIYAQGIEGATNRVKANLLEILNSLLNENDLLPLLNAAEGFLEFLDDLIDSLGGLPGLLSIIASIGLRVWGPQVASGILTMVGGIQLLYGGISGKTDAARVTAIEEVTNILRDTVVQSDKYGNTEAPLRSVYAKEDAARTIATEKISGGLNEYYKELLHILELVVKEQEQISLNAAKKVDDTSDAALSAEEKAKNMGSWTIGEKTPSKLFPGEYIDKTQTIDAAEAVNSVLQAVRAENLDVQKGLSVEQFNSMHKEVRQYGTKELRLALDLEAQKNSLLRRRDRVGSNLIKKTENQIEDFKKLGKDTTELTQKLNKLKVTQKQVRSELDKSNKSYAQLAKSMKASNKAIEKNSGNNKDAKEALTGVLNAELKNADAVRQSNIEKENAIKLQEQYNNKLREGKDSNKNWTTNLVNGMLSAASVLAGIQMLHGAFSSLSASIADGSATFSDYLSALVSIGFALPMIIQGYLKLINVEKVSNALTGTKLFLQKLSHKEDNETTKDAIKNAFKRIGANAKEVASNIGKAISGWVAMLTNWPAGTIAAIAIAGVLAAVGAAVVGGISGSIAANREKEAEEERANNIENAEASMEAAEGWKEQSSSMNDLIEKHKQLTEASDGTVASQKEILETQEAIIKQLPALITEYKKVDEALTDIDFANLISKLEGLQKLYENAIDKEAVIKDIEELTDEMDKATALGVSKDANAGVNSATENVVRAIGKLTGDKVEGSYINWHVGGTGATSNFVEQAINDSDLLGDYKNIKLDFSDPAKFILQYEELLRILKEAEELEDFNPKNNDAYDEIKTGLNAAKEDYEKLKELYAGAQDYNLTALQDEMNIDVSTIDSYAEYLKIRNKFAKKAVAEGKATEAEAKEFFSGLTSLKSFDSIDSIIDTFLEKDEDGNIIRTPQIAKDIEKFAKGLSEEEITIFAKVDFNSYETEEAWKAQMEFLEEQAETDKYDANLTTMLDAYGSLKSDMDRDDYEKLQTQLKWGEEGLANFSDFLKGDFTQQQNYLNKKILESSELALESAEKGLDILEKRVKIATGTEKQNLEKQIEQQKILIELIKIEGEEAEIAIYKEKKAREDNIKALREEIDLYYRLNDLKRVSSNLSDKIAEAKDKAYGAARIKYMELERKALEQEIRLNDKEIAQSKELLKYNKELLAGLGLNIKYDEWGNIDNYTELLKSYIDRLSAMQNAGDTSSKEYLALESEYKQFKDYTKDYQEELEKQEELTKDSADKQAAIIESRLEEIEYKVEIKLELNERERAKFERQLERLTNDAYDGASKVINLQGQANTYIGDMNTNREGIKSILKNAGATETQIQEYLSGNVSSILNNPDFNLSQSDFDALKEYTDGFISAEQGLFEAQLQVLEAFSAGFDAWIEKLSSVGETIQNQSSIIENYQNIVDTMGKERLGLTDADLKNMEDLQNQAAAAAVDNAKALMDLTRETLANVSARKAEAEQGSEEYKFWLQEEERLNKQLQEDTINFTSLWESAIQTAYDTFAKETERAIKKFDDAIAGANFDSMDELEKAFNREKEIADRYLEDYQLAYELSKLNRTIQKNLDKTDSVRSAKVLKELLKEISDIQASGKQMSEWELNALLKKYELRLAEIALEDALNAKSTVRLRRDSEGNFGYIYTANLVAIDKAQLDYEDKLYALQKLNDDYLEQLESSIISNRKQMVKELAALNLQEFENDAEYLKARQEIIDKYSSNERYYISQMNGVMINNQAIRDLDIIDYGGYTTEHNTTTGTWVTTFNDTMLGMKSGYTSVEDFLQSLNNAIGSPTTSGSLLYEFDLAYQDLGENLTEVFNLAGIDTQAYNDKTNGYLGIGGTTTKIFSEFKNHVASVMGNADNPTAGTVAWSIKQASDATKDLQEQGNKYLNGPGGLADNVTTFYDKYSEKMGKAKVAADDLDEALGNLAKEYTITINTPTLDNVTKLAEALERIAELLGKAVTIGSEGLKGNNNDGSGSGEIPDSDNNNKRISFTNAKGGGHIVNGDYVHPITGATYHFNEKTGKWYQAYTRDEAGNKVYSDGFKRDGNTVSWDADATSYTQLEIQQYATALKMANQDRYYVYVKDMGKWISKGSMSDSKWNNIKQYGTTSAALHSNGDDGYLSYTENQIATISQLSLYLKDQEWQMDRTAWYYNKVKNGLVTDGEQAGDIMAGVFTPHTPNIKFTGDVIYDTSKLGYYALAKVTQGDGVPGGVDEGETIWVPINRDTKYLKKGKAQNTSNWYELYSGAKEFTADPKIQAIMNSFDTGGYTGSWGPEGRLAMLHQKEIVLNAHDTENLLTAVSMIREISDKLESNALAMRYLGAIGNYNAAINTSNHDTLQQEVTIHAEFPNATNHSEIEEAFGNLVNLASQYANRK